MTKSTDSTAAREVRLTPSDLYVVNLIVKGRDEMAAKRVAAWRDFLEAFRAADASRQDDDLRREALGCMEAVGRIDEAIGGYNSDLSDVLAKILAGTA